MKKPTITEILNTYGISDARVLHKVIRPVKRPPYTQDYAYKLWRGALPISRKIAMAIRDYTNGALTLDLLLSLGQEGNGR